MTEERIIAPILYVMDLTSYADMNFCARKRHHFILFLRHERHLEIDILDILVELIYDAHQ
jgi:hypothetical protein